MGLEWVQNSLRIDLESTLQTGSPDWSRDASDDPQMTLSKRDPQNKALLEVFITFAELKDRPSRDWIRPPTPFAE